TSTDPSTFSLSSNPTATSTLTWVPATRKMGSCLHHWRPAAAGPTIATKTRAAPSAGNSKRLANMERTPHGTRTDDAKRTPVRVDVRHIPDDGRGDHRSTSPAA